MKCRTFILLCLTLLIPACKQEIQAPIKKEIRVAIIGGVSDNAFWDNLTAPFIKESGYEITLVAAGPKDVIAPYMREGKVDLITMHSSDTMINLVADGYACDPQPWLKNDLVIVGPPSDPAGIRGMVTAAEALKTIVEKQALFVVHASLGSQEVLRDNLNRAKVDLNPQDTIVLLEDRQRRVLRRAEDENAYTMVGRLPFIDGKMPRGTMEIMVRGDSYLRRPYLVATANPLMFPDANIAGAKALAKYLREPRTQLWILNYGKGKYDDQPLFYPAPGALNQKSAATQK